MGKKPQMIDDADFNRITRAAIKGREEEASQEAGIDLDLVERVLEERRGHVPGPAAVALAALEEQDWLAYQLVDGYEVKPVVVLRATVRGVAAISAEGEPALSDEFLIALTIGGTGDLDDVRLQVLTKLTPAWHPQISSRGEIAMDWAGKNWTSFFAHVRRVISYQAYDCEEHVLNPAAANWAMKHRSLFPLTTEP